MPLLIDAPSSPKRRLAAYLSRPSLYVYLTLALSALGLLLGYRLSQGAGMAQLGAVASERLELYAASLEAELARHAYLPSLIAIDEEVQSLLQPGPADAALAARVSRKLAGISVRSGAAQILVVDAAGQLRADSQGSAGGRAPPRLGEALAAGLGHFFAADARNSSTDFVQLQPLRSRGGLIGAIVVRINLAPLEATWVDLGLRSQSEKLLVLDRQDVAVMSSVPAWRYRTLANVDEPQRRALRADGRYGEAALGALPISAADLAQPAAALLTLPATELGMAGSATLLAQQRSVDPLGLRLVTLSDPSEVWRQARYTAWGGGAFGAALGLLALYLASRRRAVQQLFTAQTELQHAHSHLERLVDARTAELRATNAELKRQIAQRLRAEDELLQAGKLAVLGQMSAGISHELNQPLTALRVLSGNTQKLQDAGRHETVAENLRTIDAMVERMSLITRQLKSFARKAEPAAVPVSLAAAVRNVLLLLEHRLRAEQVQLRIEVAESLRVLCDATRLEQVLLNLCANALDAMQNNAEDERELAISTEPGGERVRVRVADTGSGIAPALMPRLFEPFFTTKPAGQGLGLGLVISSKIVHEFGGTLRPLPGETGMVFEFDLELAKHV